MKAQVWLAKRGFGIEIDNTLNINWESLTDKLLDIPTVHEVDGPCINGIVGVIYDDEDRPDDVLIKEIQRVCQPFIATASRRRRVA